MSDSIRSDFGRKSPPRSANFRKRVAGEKPDGKAEDINLSSTALELLRGKSKKAKSSKKKGKKSKKNPALMGELAGQVALKKGEMVDVFHQMNWPTPGLDSSERSSLEDSVQFALARKDPEFQDLKKKKLRKKLDSGKLSQGRIKLAAERFSLENPAAAGLVKAKAIVRLASHRKTVSSALTRMSETASTYIGISDSLSTLYDSLKKSGQNKFAKQLQEAEPAWIK